MAMNEDEFNFENDESIGGNSSLVKSSQGSNTSSLWSGKLGRTKSQRKKARQEEQEEKTVRFSLSPERDSLSSAISFASKRRRRRKKQTFAKKTNPESFLESLSSSQSSLGSSGSSSKSSFSSRQEQRQGYYQDSSTASRTCSSSIRSSQDSLMLQEETSPDVAIRGAGTDILAVQDAGSYRMLFDDVSYLCSTIMTASNKTSALEAAIDLALLLTNKKTKCILLYQQQQQQQGGTGALAAILETLSAIKPKSSIALDGILGIVQEKSSDYDLYCNAMLSPDGKLVLNGKMTTRTKFGRKRAHSLEEATTKNQSRDFVLLQEALAAVLHLISWDCTTCSKHSSTGGNAGRARLVRSAILQHTFAMKHACQLVLLDPIVEDILNPALDSSNIKSASPAKSLDNDDASSKASSIDTRESLSDGKPRRRKKRRIQLGQNKTRQLQVISEQEEFSIQDSPNKLPAGVPVDVHLSFHSDDDNDNLTTTSRLCGEEGSVASVASEQISEKMAKVRAAMVLSEEEEEEEHKARDDTQQMCTRHESKMTNLFLSSDFVLNSLSRIIEGKEGDQVSCIEHETGESDLAIKRLSQDSIQEEEQEDEEEQLLNNPLLVTNTLLRKGGALPVLARAMAETLSAVIVILSSGDTLCNACLLHLRQRVAVLASLIDGACCLTLENRTELCGEGSYLLSSILLFLKAFTDAEHKHSLTLGLLDEIALSTLRTLTSLSHDNEVARDLLMKSYKENTTASSVPLPGVLILANLLWKTVSNSDQYSHVHSSYDMVIFCLNTLSNAVEAKNLRRMLKEYKVPVNTDSNGNCAASSKEERFLTWLSRWLFLETSTFRNAVLSGTFGQKAEGSTSHEMRHLEKDAEENLITAGNGFIFLTCLMIQTKTRYVEGDQLFTNIREIILKELQVDDKNDGSSLLLMKNTLKAFCNFYHYSLGDLSVAIVAPVGQLITELERMQGQGKRETELEALVY